MAENILFKELTNAIVDFSKKDYASYFGCALAGEVGELCNIIKKLERDGLKRTFNQLISKDGGSSKKHYNPHLYIKNALSNELADVFIYTELVARFFNIDLEEAVRDKLLILDKRPRLDKKIVIDDPSEVAEHFI